MKDEALHPKVGLRHHYSSFMSRLSISTNRDIVTTVQVYMQSHSIPHPSCATSRTQSDCLASCVRRRRQRYHLNRIVSNCAPVFLICSNQGPLSSFVHQLPKCPTPRSIVGEAPVLLHQSKHPPPLGASQDCQALVAGDLLDRLFQIIDQFVVDVLP